jgi:deoxyhypusine synthase
MSKYKKLDFKGIKTYSIHDRVSKVHSEQFAKVLQDNPSFKDFFSSLPQLLTGKDFTHFIAAYRQAIETSSMILFMIGAHVIKVGLSPLLIDAMQRGWIRHLALNGAGVIHDIEVALYGCTSEDVAQGLHDGSFGMVRESTQFINQAIKNGKGKLGYAESVAQALTTADVKNPHLSLLYTAYRLNIPVTAHSAIGTEIIHQHPDVDPQALGETAWSDFQIFTHSVSSLNKNSIILNIGSAVILPEVFLKGLTIARNLGHQAYGFTTATFDMIRHYRPAVNVVERPTAGGGHGYYFLGHHEIMLPLLFAALKSL